MKHLKKFKKFEAVIMPDKIESDTTSIRSFEELVGYGEENNFDVVNYDDFYNSLTEEDKKTAPPKFGVPFFALFHPQNKKPMFVLSDNNAPRFIPNFIEIVNDIIGHERVHAEQGRRNKSEIDYSLPSPTDRKAYFSNKEEIMAFSWTIANGLSKTNNNIKDALKELDTGLKIKGGGVFNRNTPVRPPEHMMLWNSILNVSDEKVIKRYRKYIYLYLEKIFKDD